MITSFLLSPISRPNSPRLATSLLHAQTLPSTIQCTRPHTTRANSRTPQMHASSPASTGAPAPTKPSDETHMRTALTAARAALAAREVPVGAVLVDAAGRELARGANCVEREGDCTRHAEMVCLQAAMRARGSWRLTGTTLYSTLEPCAMCLSAASLARVSAVVFGARDLRLGACGTWVDLAAEPHPFHSFADVRGGVLDTEAAELLRGFFRMRRRERAQTADASSPAGDMQLVEEVAAAPPGAERAT